MFVALPITLTLGNMLPNASNIQPKRSLV